MRVLLLVSQLGYGHTRAAQAVDEALRERDSTIEVEYIDFWSLMDPEVAGVVKQGYLDLVTNEPDVYDRLYQLDSEQWRELLRQPELPEPLHSLIGRVMAEHYPDYHGAFPVAGSNLDRALFFNLMATFVNGRSVINGNLVRRGLILWMHSLGVRRLKQRLERFRPDVIVATQMLPASMVASLKRKRELDDIPTVAVLTDYGVHDFWLRSNMDHYCVATDAMAAELRVRGAVDASIAVIGVPLMQCFRAPKPQLDARQALNIEAGKPAVLITGGGCGIGTGETLLSMLASGLDCRLLVTGTGDPANQRRLQAIAREHPGRVYLFQQQVSMATLIRAADVVVGKPGGLSVTEALACGRPFLAVRSLGGQETFNVNFLGRNGIGGRVSHEQLLERLQHWFANPGQLARVQAKAWAVGSREAAPAIANAIIGAAGAGAIARNRDSR